LHLRNAEYDVSLTVGGWFRTPMFRYSEKEKPDPQERPWRY
jgi:hypothetical protein